MLTQNIMSKSIKFRNNVYLDTTSITHKRTLLSSMLNGYLGCRHLFNRGVESKNDVPFDLNDLKAGETCSWDYNHHGKNVPISGGRCYCICHYSSSLYQFVISVHDSYIYVRMNWSGSWSAWRKI